MSQYITHSVTQGSPEWHALRAKHFCASEAAAMMGVSPYMTRSELLRQKKTGIVPDVDAQTQKRFDDGHATEAAFRPVVERIIGQDLYPVVGTLEVDGLPLLASFDGLTADDETGYEHKRINNDLRALRDAEAPMVPDQYVWQLEQQMLVSGARGIWFCASDGTEDDSLLIYYESDPELRAKLIAGWKQFAADLEAYVPEPEAAPKPVGMTPETLPALRIEVTGMVTASNLDAYREHAIAVFKGINRELVTDQHFADAEKTVKWCKDVEDRLDAAKQHALSQTESIDTLFRTIDQVSAEARTVRLELDRLVKARKEEIRLEIITDGRKAFDEHVAALNARIGKPYVKVTTPDFAASIRGKKSVTSMRDAVATDLAHNKIAASEAADNIEANLKLLRAVGPRFSDLFADEAIIVHKAADDLIRLIKSRIDARIEAEAKRLADEKAAAEATAAAEAATAAAAPPVSPPNPAEQPQATPAVAPVNPVKSDYCSPAPAASPVVLAFLASREWQNDAAKNSARAVLVEFERFCAQRERAEA